MMKDRLYVFDNSQTISLPAPSSTCGQSAWCDDSTGSAISQILLLEYEIYRGQEQ